MNAVNNISYGLYVVTSKLDKDNGCVCNTLCQVTTNPNRVTITLNKDNYTTKQIADSGKFNVSILDETTNFELIERFGFLSGKNKNKFEGFVDFDYADNGIAYITKHTNSYLSCEVIDKKDLGSHIQFFADVIVDYVLNANPSATYAYYQKNIKPQPKIEKVAYVCSVCGYVYQGDIIPDDYICPICKHDKSAFEIQKQSTKSVEESPKTNNKTLYVCPVCGYSVESDTPPDKCVICGANMEKK